MRKLKFSTCSKGSTVPMLVEAARFGDENAYAELIRRTYSSVKAYCAVMGSRSESEDLAQEAYVRAIRGNTPILDTDNLEAFMIAIAKFVCADYLKSKAKVSSIQHKLKSATAQSPLPNDLSLDFDLLDCLSIEHQQTLVLTSVLGFSYEEVAQITDVPIGTVRSRLSRAKDILKKNIKNGTIVYDYATS